MLIKTILNQVCKHRSFIYGAVRFEQAKGEIEVAVRARANSRPCCSGCGRAGASYDRQPSRRFAFVPLWGLKMFFVYAPRRWPVAVAACGSSSCHGPTASSA